MTLHDVAIACGSFGLLTPASVPANSAAPPAPTAEELRITLNTPQLLSCDDLVCFYRPMRNYAVRAVHCAAGQLNAVVCVYERTLVSSLSEPRVWKEGEPVPPDTRRWSRAETELKHLHGRWIVVKDSDH